MFKLGEPMQVMVPELEEVTENYWHEGQILRLVTVQA
jgi:hypothetical protein